MNKMLGYYTCGGIEFESKVDAAIYGTRIHKPVNWHFHQEVFSKANWSVEPEPSLDSLYDRRARELRERYDYIILSYSGGADSNNILESFLRQGLFIDEIIVNHFGEINTFVNPDPNIKNSWNSEAEHVLQAMPRLQYIHNVSPKTKINVVKVGQNLFKLFEDAGDESWIQGRKESLNVGGLSRFNYLYYKEVRNSFDKGKKLAMIFGVDKPRTFIKDGNYFISFTDRALNIAPASEHYREYENITVENFYWHPDSTDMLIKQAHVIKRFIEMNPQYYNLWMLDKDYQLRYKIVIERMLRTIIYTTWDNNWYQADKSVSDWFNEFDTWFYKGYEGTKAYNAWQAGLEYVKKNAADNLKYTEDGKIAGLKLHAQTYEIGPMNIMEKK